MRIDELFDVPFPLTRMMDFEIEESGIKDVVAAWNFKANGIRYVVFFSTYGSNNDDEYNCGFVYYHGNPVKKSANPNSYSTADRPVTYNNPPVTQKNAYPVFSTVVQAIRLFISEFKPNLIVMTALSDLRMRMYKAIANKLSTNLPENYALEFNTSNVCLVKKDFNITESKLTELFDKPSEFTVHPSEHGVYYLFEIEGARYLLGFETDGIDKRKVDAVLELKSSPKEQPYGTTGFDIQNMGRIGTKVYATCLKIFEFFIHKRPDINMIEMSGFTRKQTDIYYRIAKYLKSQFSDWNVILDDEGTGSVGLFRKNIDPRSYGWIPPK